MKKLLLTLTLVLCQPVIASEMTPEEWCKVKADTAEIIVDHYHTGGSKVDLLLIYQGTTPALVETRALIHAVYRGAADNLTAEKAWGYVHDLCIANIKE